MRLYNPNFQKYQENLKNNAKQYKAREIVGTLWMIFAILATIGMLAYLIVIKAAWYFYLIDIGCGFILVMLSVAIFPAKEKEFIDFEEISDGEVDLEAVKERFPDKKVLHKSVSDIARNTVVGFAYSGIFRGIAVCECGEIYDPENITYNLTEHTANSRHSENGNMTTFEKANVTVQCKCARCGKETSETFFGVVHPTGSVKRRQEMFSSVTTITTTSIDADYGQFVADVYEQDIMRYKNDSAEYAQILKKKQEEMKREKEWKRKDIKKRIETLRAKGWYEKED